MFVRGILVIALAIASIGFAQQYSEAPMLAARVAEGQLPPVEERLPERPVVVTPVESVGTYGGTWRLVHITDRRDARWWNLVSYEGLAMWDAQYTEMTPQLAESWEFNEDATELILRLRPGLKWSDGVPMTAEDYVFWWNEVVLGVDGAGNASPYTSWMQPWTMTGGEPMELEQLDEYTILHRFHGPAPTAPYWWATEVQFVRVWPTHFVKQFHPNYADDVDDWDVMFQTLSVHGTLTVGQPVLTPWVTVEHLPLQRRVLERNPYFWKVDPQGNQLPYIDRVVLDYVETLEAVKVRILNGQVDFQVRPEMTGADYPTLIGGQEAGGYKVVLYSTGRGAQPALFPNLNHQDPDLQAFFRDQRVRVALSQAIDRQFINEIIYNGLLKPFQGTLGADSWHFKVDGGPELLREWQQAYAEYDPELANSLLDEAGFERGQDGMRRFADGRPIVITALINVADQLTKQYVDAMQIVLENWRAVGIRLDLQDVPPEEYLAHRNSFTYDILVYESSDLDAFSWPAAIIPSVNPRQWPEVTRWYMTNGAQGIGPGAFDGDVEERLLAIWDEMLVTPSDDVRHRLVHDAIRIHIEEGPFFIGVVGEPTIPGVIRHGFRNVGEFGVFGPHWMDAPRNMYPEQFFMENAN